MGYLAINKVRYLYLQVKEVMLWQEPERGKGFKPAKNMEGR